MSAPRSKNFFFHYWVDDERIEVPDDHISIIVGERTQIGIASTATVNSLCNNLAVDGNIDRCDKSKALSFRNQIADLMPVQASL